MKANKRVCPALQCQTDEEKSFNPSIPQFDLGEPIISSPILIDAFKGKVKAFKVYLKIQRILFALPR